MAEVVDLCGNDTEGDKPSSKRLRVATPERAPCGNSLLASLHRECTARHGEPNAGPTSGCTAYPAPTQASEPAGPVRTLQQRVGRDRRIRWRPEEESVDAWLSAVPPSVVGGAHAANWLQLCNPVATSPGFDRTRGGRFDSSAYDCILARQLAAAERSTQEAEQQEAATIEEILRVAKVQGMTTGKWMLRVKPDMVDAVWGKVARATARGELGCSAKVAPARGAASNERLLICVYVSDFSVRAEVRRVLQRLNSSLPKNGPLAMVPIGFKADVFTHLEIDHGNMWKLRATLYREEQVLAWDESV